MLPAAVLPSPGKIQFRATMFLTSFNNVQDSVVQSSLGRGSKNITIGIKK